MIRRKRSGSFGRVISRRAQIRLREIYCQPSLVHFGKYDWGMRVSAEGQMGTAGLAQLKD